MQERNITRSCARRLPLSRGLEWCGAGRLKEVVSTDGGRNLSETTGMSAPVERCSESEGLGKD